MLSHFSLFSGIGGIDFAAEMAGFTTVGQCEFADYPTKVLEKHWPNVLRWRDVRDVTYESVRNRGIGEITLMSGGIPCQPHSVAGKRQASADERDLWPEYRRVISELRPKWILVENVPGLFSSENGRFFGNILRDLAALGYSVGWCVYGANDVGAPHKRDRVFIMGHVTSQRLQNGGRAQVADAGETESELERCGSLSRGIQALGYASGSGLSGKQWRRTGKEPENGHIESEKKDMADSESYNEGRMCGRDAEAFAGPSCGSKDVADTSSTGREERNASTESTGQAFDTGSGDEKHGGNSGDRQESGGTYNGATESGLGGDFDGISPRLYEHRWPALPGERQYEWEPPRVKTGAKNRVGRLKCLGNAVVPQQVYPILAAIAEMEGYE